VKAIYDSLAIDNLDDLETAARRGKLRSLPGIKTKSEENILRGIAILRQGRERTPLGTALSLGVQTR